MIFKTLLFAILLALSYEQQVNSVSIQGNLDSVFGCWLTIKNTEQILDLRTDCRLGNSTDTPGLNRLV